MFSTFFSLSLVDDSMLCYDLTGNKNLICEAKLELIGDLHCHAAVKKVYKRKLSFSLETMFKSFYKTLK